ncbi:hypothetical protein A3C98_01400 [Candidatus Roizmanbacteria bacterium RIFCSPHIGHO2_02_FULL_37_15]|uniref:Uncharacterized protein n=1 Tax=Candidatus Roizmanbacteria bacterium RIFCSPLOWO2_01_FULL_37_16 TaxID=1802058 RepID=A0A1F7IQH3_9BACT|nr:MAG: hypothetical protein A2859_03215 [Candidatus Roizmanbacteria bacterium RIFCSPHIGHO2_01_FULL_37_16b]OGK21130.1 MAG: hypothetical protein A3C98_01400 [Candidatus Roizmanbacteria bacterium RIFCSPHIGHO2_02_FULL_37_15]OGK45608.1 MAG: hypothetical protein A3B40_00240 [Candidatus Roizmanbacteria bacterium RIFCSPLOWO2_01_FULL_37_16]OGK56005.1 MAG: hypothetical protein A3I50_02930 [Candidatus Roizmanbacteria bacterium RIFCSPLOWO2_02_FULL_37_9]
MSGQSEWASSVVNLETRVYAHLPSSNILQRSPTDDEIETREKHRKIFPGADFTIATKEGKLYFVPSWHDLNRIRGDAKGVHYAKAIFEGGSFVPVTERENSTKVTHGNIILARPRNKRYRKSWQALGYDVETEDFNQCIFDLAAVLGENVLKGPDGEIGRAYIRPAGVVITEGTGVGSAADDVIFNSVYIHYFPSYFPGRDERIYHGDGLNVTIFLDQQRLEPIVGKLARNYPLVGDLTRRARELGDEEAVLLAPYGFNPITGGHIRRFAQDGENALIELLLYQYFSDGPGEGLIAVSARNGRRELWYPPEFVNQLPSTTMAYICRYLAPDLGFKVIERPFGFYEIRKGLVDNIIMVGNAVGAAIIGNQRIIHPSKGEIEVISMPISEPAKLIRDAYADQISERTPPSNPSLLTRVDFNSPQVTRAREILYNAWKLHF